MKTQNGTEVVLKEFLTGRDLQAIEAVLFEGVEMSPGGKPKFNPQLVSAQQNKAIQVCVVSVGGKTENVLDAVLDLPAADYTEVLEAVQKLQGLNTEKKS